MAVTLVKVLCFLPLLFVLNSPASVNSQPAYQNAFQGKWELVSQNAGVSAMHNILIPKTSKILLFDSTIWRISKLPLPPQKMPCRLADPVKKMQDCWAHSVLFDVESSNLTAVKVDTDTWCSSGGLTIDGVLASTGGFQGGARTVRYLSSCENCDWKEYPTALADPRWYGTQVTLPDGNFLVFGGRDAFSYEYVPREGQFNNKAVFFPFLRDTTDNYPTGNNKFFRLENNLYPFVHLVPDGNIFVFANNRSVLLDAVNNKVIREYPILAGGSRNYPASGMSVILPIKLDANYNPATTPFEVMVCGGAPWDSFYYAEVTKQYVPALQDCGRINLMDQNPVWIKENMPTPRVMGEMRLLPNGDVLFINGAKTGSSAWGCADDPNFVPALYRPDGPVGFRFQELSASTIPRMYHSSSELLPDGTIFVGGSNTNDGYIYNVKYPTELRVEKFSPPCLDPTLADLRQEIMVDTTDKVINFGQNFSVKVRSKQSELTKNDDLKVTMYAPSFNTHGVAMNQRLLMVGVADVVNNVAPGIHSITAVAPPSGKVAPPGYYLLFVVYKGVPSAGIWIQIK